MVEPLPWVFTRLRDNYRGQEGVTFENAAIADADGRVPFYYVTRRRGPRAGGPPDLVRRDGLAVAR